MKFSKHFLFWCLLSGFLALQLPTSLFAAQAPQSSGEEEKEKADKEAQDHQCQICFDADDLKELRCGHKICTGCFTTLLGYASTSKDMSCMKCSIGVCATIGAGKATSRLLEEEDFQRVATKEQLSSIHEIQFERCVLSSSSISRCPKAGCGYAFEKPYNSQQVQCPECLTRFCSGCLLNHQSNITCAQARSAKQANEAPLPELTQRCPNAACNVIISRDPEDTSCKFVDCTNCQQEFCWVCLKGGWPMHRHTEHDCVDNGNDSFGFGLVRLYPGSVDFNRRFPKPWTAAFLIRHPQLARFAAPQERQVAAVAAQDPQRRQEAQRAQVEAQALFQRQRAQVEAQALFQRQRAQVEAQALFQRQQVQRQRNLQREQAMRLQQDAIRFALWIGFISVATLVKENYYYVPALIEVPQAQSWKDSIVSWFVAQPQKLVVKLPQNLEKLVQTIQQKLLFDAPFTHVTLRCSNADSWRVLAQEVAARCQMQCYFITAKTIDKYLVDGTIVQKLEKLFAWTANASKRTMLYFEATDLLLAHAGARELLLAYLRTPNQKIMILCATNQLQNLGNSCTHITLA